MRRFVYITLLALASLRPVPASAQDFPPGRFQIAGFPVACGLAWTLIRPGIGDIARAVPASLGTPPAILLDPMFAGLPVPVQLFIYGHECAHHFVGVDENAADCWSVKLGRRQGWFNQQSMQYLVQAFAWNPGDWTHAPGPVRLQNIWNCYINP